MDVLDFRSDTVTQPTDEMRDAMRDAEVGDDVLGDDPTVNQLQAMAAEKMGMDAGLFVPSGTMANQIALWVHNERQGQTILDSNSHIALYEGGAAALLSGTTLRTLVTENGTFTADQIRPHLMPDDPHFAPTRCIALENTHNWAGGTIWNPDHSTKLSGFAHKHGVKVHVDGARIFHAAVATGAPVTAWTSAADSVMFCLSKGLSAPVGSVLCGSHEFIHAARRVRKALGGGMRQAGTIAAAGIVALETMIDRLADDHANALALANSLAQIDGLEILGSPPTNIVYADVRETGMNAEDAVELLNGIGVRCLPRDSGSVIRFVTHRHLDSSHIEEAVDRVGQVLKTNGR